MTNIIFMETMISLAFAAVCSLVWAAEGRQTKDPLSFPKDSYTVETKTLKTSAGEKKVTYRSYRHIPYVANPVDKDYQSLDVSVPINVDAAAVDAANAPILFDIGIGRMKGLPAFDDFATAQPEPILFGTKTANARHFTDFSLRQTSGDKGAKIDHDLHTAVKR